MKRIEPVLRKKLDKEVSLLVRHSCNDPRLLTHGKNISYTEFFSNRLLLVCIIREGVPYSFFDLIQQITPFNENDWANFLDISTKSLHRYKESARHFKPIQSEKIIEMAEVTNVGLDVFESIEKFKLWLDTPNYALGNLKPMELLKDSYGKEMVVSELTRINYGVLA
ncbi:MAG: DUF2384 domain-containing protein [Chitinophagaceae bacterium]|nr:DUF2384 domain-containing protein [Chitinophagaceae bacterium]